MLLVGQVLLLFGLKNFGIAIADGAFASPWRGLLVPRIVQGEGVRYVRPGSGKVGRERTFENCAGRKGEHVEREKGEEISTNR